MHPLLVLIRRDFLLEWRTRDVVTATGMFAVIVVMMLSFALSGVGDRLNPAVQSAVLWIAFAFSGTLGLSRAFAREQDGGALDGLKLAPIDWSLLYVAKLVSTTVFTLTTNIVTLAVFCIFLGVSLDAASVAVLVALVAAANIGHVAVGLVLAAMTLQARAREVLLPVLLFPLLIPLFLGAVHATTQILSTTDVALANPESFWQWVGLIAGYDIIFVALGLAVFPIVLRE